MRKVMVSPLAGTWYPAYAQALKDDLAEYLRDLSPIRRSGICAAVVPHSRYRFSGRVAGGVLKRIDVRSYTRIVVMGPSHYVPLRNQISVPDASQFRTPLGSLKVDEAWLDAFCKLDFVCHAPEAHIQEHSDQIQLPLIQTCLSCSLPVVCMVCGQFDAAHMADAAAKMRALLDDQTLVIVSSDYTHQGATCGFQSYAQEVAQHVEHLDASVFELFVRRNLKDFMKYLRIAGPTVCGRDPLGFLFLMMPYDAVVQKTFFESSERLTYTHQQTANFFGAVVSGRWQHPAVSVN
jgi:AmmeMemoRadiSam system protein B